MVALPPGMTYPYGLASTVLGIDVAGVTAKPVPTLREGNGGNVGTGDGVRPTSVLTLLTSDPAQKPSGRFATAAGLSIVNLIQCSWCTYRERRRPTVDESIAASLYRTTVTGTVLAERIRLPSWATSSTGSQEFKLGLVELNEPTAIGRVLIVAIVGNISTGRQYECRSGRPVLMDVYNPISPDATI